MFDDQPVISKAGGGQTPANLPVGEPEDVFGDMPETLPGPPPLTEPTVGGVAAEQVSAVDAGILKPVSPRLSARPLSITPPLASSGLNTIKDPTSAKRLMIIIAVAAGLLIIGGGSWFIYRSFIMGKSPASAPGTARITPPTPLPPAPTSSPAAGAGQAPVSPATADDAILFGQPIDSDADNLDNSREQIIGTDPNNWDTDGDELSDGDEVIIWKTDPLRPDTDQDSFPDGVEVKNGYSPTGPGKIFEPPARAL